MDSIPFTFSQTANGLWIGHPVDNCHADISSLPLETWLTKQSNGTFVKYSWERVVYAQTEATHWDRDSEHLNGPDLYYVYTLSNQLRSSSPTIVVWKPREKGKLEIVCGNIVQRVPDICIGTLKRMLIHVLQCTLLDTISHLHSTIRDFHISPGFYSDIIFFKEHKIPPIAVNLPPSVPSEASPLSSPESSTCPLLKHVNPNSHPLIPVSKYGFLGDFAKSFWNFPMATASTMHGRWLTKY